MINNPNILYNFTVFILMFMDYLSIKVIIINETIDGQVGQYGMLEEIKVVNDFWRYVQSRS